ncbi:MAG: methionine--tRNA ligase [Candidatus Gracilibacteria bacterium]|nr:methionine--tRNA ligase [Candidatus Gracilibacteria bacterium]
MKDTFFITTPIYYTNGVPHIGHAYSSIIADTIARHQKISGKQIKFSTGVDENSQKAVDAAEALGMETMPYLDMMADKHKAVWDGLNIKYTDFIRTTEQRHHNFVREVLQKSFDKGDIYEGEYEGMYCVGCEGFKKDEDLVYLNKTTNSTFPIDKKVVESDNIIKVCPDHLKTPDKIKEKNYFFKLSKYQEFLEEYYDENDEFVVPNERYNEVKAFVKRGLDDFSISRETNKFGIKLPFDETQVTYVWYDALFNYLTVCDRPHTNPLLSKQGRQDQNDMKFWPADLHVVAKDIIRFHAIYWPAMLKSAGYDLPKQILTTGYYTVEGQKISKTLGNAIDPVEFCKKYSKDLLTLYLLSSINIGQDGDFDLKQAILIYNAKLANNFGNLVNRVVVLALKIGHPQGVSLPNNVGVSLVGTLYTEIADKLDDYVYIYNHSAKEYNLKDTLDLSFKFLDDLNTFTTYKQPWQTIKDESLLQETRDVLYTIAEGLRQVGLNLYPFFPEKMGELFTKLGLEGYIDKLESGKLEELRKTKEVFNIKEKGEVLFSRFEVE